MFNKLVLAAVFLFAAVTVFNTQTVKATTEDEKVTICHATNASTNPYTVNTVDKSSVDEVNNKYLNGHGDHTGPVFDPSVHNQQNRGWGDIIPPFTSDSGTSYPGQNWDSAGQAIWENDCNIPPVVEEAVITFDVDCVIDGDNATVRVTFRNFGDTNGTAKLNGEDVEVAAGATEVRDLEAGVNVKIEIDEKVAYDQTPDCEVPEDDGEVLSEDDQVQAPVGAVKAGGGGGSNVSAATALALVGSLAIASFGAYRLKQLK